MARKQITDRSSAADRAQAASELRQAQQEFSQWVNEARNDPTRPRDIFEGVDYGPLITYNDLAQQKRIIAGQYDYVDFGDLDGAGVGNRLNIGGEDFYVPGLGSNPDVIPSTPAPSSSLSAADDAAIQIPSEPQTPSVTFPNFDRNTRVQESPAVNIKDRLEQLDATDPRIGGFSSRDTAIVNAPDPDSFDPRGRNQLPTISSNINSDDSGNVSGTGIESGRFTSRLDTKGQLNTSDVSDTGRANSTPGETTAEELPTGVITDNGQVDVSSLAQARESNGVGLYETNAANLELRQNVLHNYVNWSYKIGMYMLEPRSFADIVNNGGITNPGSELKNLLFRSGGTGRKGILGERKDYYIENFRFTSIVGQNSQGAKSSNNFDISFEIHEPYGVAFLAELVQLAHSKGIEDHFEVPYLIEIKFNGYDSAGNPIPNIPAAGPKYIPIKIIDIKFSISSAATVYHVTAVPYAHIPLQDQHDAFLRDSISLTGETFEQLIGSLSNHLNQAEINKARDEQRQPDTYQFLITDNELKSSKVGFTHANQGNVVDVAKQGFNGETNEAVQINANSTIKSAIQAISNSTDFGAKYNTTGQPESNQGNENKPYRLLKIIPVVTELGEYNTSSMRYQKNIVYKIETQKMYGFITPGMPNAGAQVRGWQKEYNWIFTGKNQDILDFQAEYNIQYFQIRNSFVDQKGKVMGTPSNTRQPLESRNKTRTEGGGNTYNPAIRTASQPVTDQVYNSYRGAGHQQASDNMDNILNNPGADMLAIDLTIIGDPDWIPQDRSILPKGTSSSGDARIVNGSLAVDSHDNFVMLKFKTPRDYNPEKGLMQIDTEQTFVQGLYRVITLESTFESGKFQQNLKLIRVQDQVSNDASNIPPLTVDTTDDARSARTNIAPDPDRGALTDRLDTKGQIRTNNKVSVGTGVSDSFVPIGRVSSARPVNPNGTQPLIRAGDETNALDAIAETQNLFNNDQ